ncbi:MAG: MBL fold metallo-hydrolase, partial [Clostridia bacterium]|nr:MBL fold metallo-hydrolase [Clostridia bacterium]
MAKFCSLFSSSSGNATFLGNGDRGILIDAGVSAKKIKEALLSREIDPHKLDGIFVTHEHTDHIKGIRIIASNYNIPVYATEGTLAALEENGTLNGKFPFEVMPAEGVTAGDLLVTAFATPHDSRESCGYKIIFPHGQRAVVATDIGRITPEVENALLGTELVMLESNHDIAMLQSGDYPYYLKRRILSDVGHLSNAACAEEAVKLIKKGTSRLFLGHLSAENNFPGLAYQTTYSALESEGIKEGTDYILKVNAVENTDGIV